MPILPQEIIRAKRDGEALDSADIKALVQGFGNEQVTDAQIAAFAMAVFFQGLNRDETVALTEAMRDSGRVLEWSHLDRPVVDKHSTGGVGDNVSLMLAPIVAACGAAVPMIAGRGLGHTGGTLDKLEAIPGYNVRPEPKVFRDAVASVGCAIVGQSGDIAPADGRFYATRDVTATVESIPLITASILSKKLAAGLPALVLDVKIGSGAFMVKPDDAHTLARGLVSVAQAAGVKTSALLTDMNEPLATAAGNGVEVRNAVMFLTGEQRDPRLHEVTLALAAQMLVLSGIASDVSAALQKAQSVLDSGAALDVFSRMVFALGGPADFVERMDEHMPAAPVIRPVLAGQGGTVAAIDARALGLAVVGLGGGRTRPQDAVDHAVGLTKLQGIGARLEADTPLAIVHARTQSAFDAAAAGIKAAYRFGDPASVVSNPVIVDQY
ncbi:thymidine phosphorylase [Aureimonas fodinaquatilis]|uniref:Thymidine phosphorylase n=1 Tax=Aureimonas fodinaquatilis TaxID=2565783 RepID=A0A5B0E3P8_9HYPH|nr:thymidine phosphorylase [Aureimonas fodinaquatilis]KAA0972029.1 thymidine phosphorylase [Aureimonas fodinaquatilis]